MHPKSHSSHHTHLSKRTQLISSPTSDQTNRNSSYIRPNESHSSHHIHTWPNELGKGMGEGGNLVQTIQVLIATRVLRATCTPEHVICANYPTPALCDNRENREESFGRMYAIDQMYAMRWVDGAILDACDEMNVMRWMRFVWSDGYEREKRARARFDDDDVMSVDSTCNVLRNWSSKHWGSETKTREA